MRSEPWEGESRRRPWWPPQPDGAAGSSTIVGLVGRMGARPSDMAQWMEFCVDIVVKGRKTEVPERFRKHCVEKLDKIRKLDSKVISVDVEVSKERNPRLAERSDRVEITLTTRGPVVRGEAAASDPYAALDLASARLEAQLRKAADRRRVHHGHRAPVSLGAATVEINNADTLNGAVVASAEDIEAVKNGELRPQPHMEGPIEVDGEGPLVVREKVHAGRPMALDQALYEMELVGHDFYLFIDAGTRWPSVVYRRHGYDYGVIHLKPEDREDGGPQ